MAKPMFNKRLGSGDEGRPNLLSGGFMGGDGGSFGGTLGVSYVGASVLERIAATANYAINSAGGGGGGEIAPSDRFGDPDREVN